MALRLKSCNRGALSDLDFDGNKKANIVMAVCLN